jgi:hypothetical protein
MRRLVNKVWVMLKIDYYLNERLGDITEILLNGVYIPNRVSTPVGEAVPFLF